MFDFSQWTPTQIEAFFKAEEEFHEKFDDSDDEELLFPADKLIEVTSREASELIYAYTSRMKRTIYSMIDNKQCAYEQQQSNLEFIAKLEATANEFRDLDESVLLPNRFLPRTQQ